MLSELKVVELASVLAGPAVGMFFAELGADVTKVENKKTKGDVTRSWKLPNEKEDPSAYFSAINYKKKYVFKDFSNSDDYNSTLELIKEADIVIANFKYGDDIKFKLDFDTIKNVNPNIIYGQIKGFKSIPERTAYDVVLQAESGFMYMNGTPNESPVKMPVALIDILAAHQLKEGILVALLKHSKNKRAYYVETSLEEAALSSLANQASNYLMNQHIPQAIGSLHPNIAPYGETFDCENKQKVVLAIGSNKQFLSLCKLLDIDDKEIETYFSNNQERIKNRKRLFQLFEPKFKTWNRKSLLEKAIKENIPMGAVRNMQEVFENPVAQDLVREEKIENRETKRVSSIAFQIS